MNHYINAIHWFIDMESGDSLSCVGGDTALARKFFVTSANLTTFVYNNNLLHTDGTMEADDVIDYI